MKVLNIDPGTSLEEAVELLVEHAPAGCVFAGVPLVANGEQPKDLIREWLQEIQERRELFAAGEREWI